MAGNHVDASILYVPIMPETSKLGEAMEKVGKDATESFGKGSSGIGDKIHDSISKSKDKLKDVFHRSGSDASEAMADGVKESSKKVEAAVEESGKKAEVKFKDAAKGWGKVLVDAVGPDTKKLLGDRLEETVGGALEGVLGENAKWAGKFSHTVADWGFDELKKKLGDTKDAAVSTKQAFASFKDGDTTAGVSKLVDSFGKLGLEAKDLPQPLQDAIGKLDEAKATAKGFAEIFNGLPGKIGDVGKAIEGLAGPLAVALAAAKDIDDEIRRSGNGAIIDTRGQGDKHSQAIADTLNKIPGVRATAPGGGHSGVDLSGVMGLGRGGDVLGSAADAYDAFSSGAPLPSSAPPPVGGWFGGGGHPASRHIGSDQGLTATSKSAKDAIATMFPQIGDIGGWRPPDGFNEHSSGQALDVMIPGAGTAQGKALGDQIRDYVMKNAKQLGVDYALWQQTQWNPDGSHSGMDNRGSPTQNHMDHVHIHTTRGGGDGTIPTDMPSQSGASSFGAGGKMPAGSEHDPLYVTQTAGAGGGGSDASNQGQQLGSGLVDGLFQGLGLDGSVFKTFGGSSNPLQFGITKLATGLFNHLGGMASRGGDGAALPGGGGGIPGLGALQGLIPGTGVSNGVVATPGQSADRGSGGYTQIVQGDVNHNPWTVNGVGSVPELKNMQNAQVPGTNTGAAAPQYMPQMSSPAFGN